MRVFAEFGRSLSLGGLVEIVFKFSIFKSKLFIPVINIFGFFEFNFNLFYSCGNGGRGALT